MRSRDLLLKLKLLAFPLRKPASLLSKKLLLRRRKKLELLLKRKLQ